MNGNMTPIAGRQSFWMRWRLAFAVGAIVIVLLVLAAEGYLLWHSRSSSPAKTVSAIAAAAMLGDAKTVAASIDTSAIADAAVEEVLSAPSGQGNLAKKYLSEHPGTTEEQVKAKVREKLNAEIRKRVESGSLSRRVPVGSDAFKALVAEALAQGAIRSQVVEGDVAHVVVAAPYKGRVYDVQVRMQRSGDTWTIDKVENLEDILSQAGF